MATELKSSSARCVVSKGDFEIEKDIRTGRDVRVVFFEMKDAGSGDAREIVEFSVSGVKKSEAKIVLSVDRMVDLKQLCERMGASCVKVELEDWERGGDSPIVRSFCGLQNASKVWIYITGRFSVDEKMKSKIDEYLCRS